MIKTFAHISDTLEQVRRSYTSWKPICWKSMVDHVQLSKFLHSNRLFLALVRTLFEIHLRGSFNDCPIQAAPAPIIWTLTDEAWLSCTYGVKILSMLQIMVYIRFERSYNACNVYILPRILMGIAYMNLTFPPCLRCHEVFAIGYRMLDEGLPPSLPITTQAIAYFPQRISWFCATFQRPESDSVETGRARTYKRLTAFVKFSLELLSILLPSDPKILQKFCTVGMYA